mgnify:FL=1|tara:strand:- start:531 stop:836 length:306 start_codon:yes stop_codon:yes gene_type:complete
MSRNSSNSSSKGLKDKINKLESEIKNIKETFKSFFKNFPEYEEYDEVPVLENSHVVARRIKKALTSKPVKVEVLRKTSKRLQRFTNLLKGRTRKSQPRASV